MTEVVVIKIICPNLHLTESWMISPVIQRDGTVEGLQSSSAHFCPECDSSDVVTLDVVLAERELTEQEQSLHRVTHTTQEV